ncbi:RNA-dependent RNA polymerase [Beihai barnacle virus 8]|uniref:Replicase n=1 Tax=Beihai barnacle virus 8 TaxID=1922366 RepID=A0A1L3KMV2_9MONO|nr:RNA-dependent RNA polymerase [Beihai barnacle virus 8]APG78659.1 RNA-dependent RNA polymerase [Beihai barnacle virus 8]
MATRTKDVRQLLKEASTGFRRPDSFRHEQHRVGETWLDTSEKAWRVQSARSFPRHLDSALTVHKLNFFRANPSQMKLHYPFVDPDCLQPISNGQCAGISIFPWLERHLLGSGRALSTQSAQLLNETAVLAAESVKLQATALYEFSEEFTLHDLHQRASALVRDQRVQSAARGKMFVCELHAILQELGLHPAHAYLIQGIPSVTFHADLVVLHSFPSGPLGITFDMFLNVLDKIESQFHFEMYTQLAGSSPVFASTPYSAMQREIYDALDAIAEELGSAAAKVMKSLEPLVVGYVLRGQDPASNDTKFLESLFNDLEEEDLAVYNACIEIHRILTSHGTIRSREEISMIMDTYGQEKLHFYPQIEEEKGSVKMYSYGSSTRPHDTGASCDLGGIFTRELVQAYYHKEGVLPDIYDDATLPDSLRAIWKSGILPSAPRCAEIPASSWNKIRFLENKKFDYHPDILDLIEDKACAPRRSRLWEVYAGPVRACMGQKTEEKPDHRRLIEWVFAQPEIDIEAMFTRANEHGHLDPEDTLILLKEKERENKTGARMFSILHPHTRLMASVLEKNIAENIYPYFPQQTMTRGGAELEQLVDSFALKAKERRDHWVYFNLDLEQWNYTFRSVILTDFLQKLDQFQGVRNHRWSMRFFSEAQFMSADGFCAPGLFDQWQAWRDYPGGNQGICQKMWTLATVLLIKETMQQLGWDHELMGSGDNQVLAVRFNRTEDLRDNVLQVKVKLQETFSRFGLLVKLEESWHSDKLLAYQRQYHWEGDPLALGLKSCARFAAGASEGGSSLAEHTSTAMGAGLTVAGRLQDPVMGPLLGLAEWYYGVLVNPVWRKDFPTDKLSRVTLSLLPSDLTGLPVLQLHGFMYAGHKDAMCESLALLRVIYDRYPAYRTSIVQGIGFPTTWPSQGSLLGLIQNPASPNLRAPPRAEAIMKRAVSAHLTQDAEIKNKRVKEALIGLKADVKEALIQELVKMRPLDLRIARALYDASPVGLVEGLAAKFLGMRSLRSIIHRKKSTVIQTLQSEGLGVDTPASEGEFPTDYERLLRSADGNQLRHLSRKFRARVVTPPSFFRAVTGPHHTAYVKWCRQKGWHPDCTLSLRVYWVAASYRVIDYNIDGPYSPAPSEQTQIHDSMEAIDDGRTIVISPAHSLPRSSILLETRRGPFALYIGSSTREPVPGLPGVSVLGQDTGSAVRTLVKLLSWLQSNQSSQEVRTFTKDLLGKRVTGLDEVADFFERRPAGGCRAHRMTLPGESAGAFGSTRTMISTWIKLSTDKASLVQRGEEDRMVFFQQIFHHIYAALRYHRPTVSQKTAKLTLNHCSYLVDESSITGQAMQVPRSLNLPPELAVPAAQQAAVLQSLEEQRSVRALNLFHAPREEEGLAASLAYLAARHAVRYTSGHNKEGTSLQGVAGPQSLLNVTLVRRTTAGVLLAATAMALSYHGVFEDSCRPDRLRRLLEALLVPRHVAVDVEVLRPLLQAAAVAGMSASLSKLAHLPPSVTKGGASGGRLRALLTAMCAVIKQVQAEKMTAALLICTRSKSPHTQRIHRFMRAWSSSYRRQTTARDPEKGFELLLQKGGDFPPVRVLIADDVNTVIEDSRAQHDPERPLPPEPALRPPPPLMAGTGNIRPPSPWVAVGSTVQEEPMPVNALPREQADPPPDPGLMPARAFQLLRWASASSGARVKLCEMLPFYQLEGEAPHLFVTLAEGTGSMASTLLHRFPNSTLIFNTLMCPEDQSGGPTLDHVPSDLVCSCELLSRVPNLPANDRDHGDLTVRAVWDRLDLAIHSQKKKITLLTWDMEASGLEYLAAVELLAEYLVTWAPHAVLIKGFVGDWESLWVRLLDSKLCQAGEWAFIKPLSSNLFSNEIYLLGRRLTAPPRGARPAVLVDPLAALLASARALPPTQQKNRLAHALTWTRTQIPCVYTPAIPPTDPHPALHRLTDVEAILGAALNLVEVLHQSYHPIERCVPRGLQHMVGSRALGAGVITQDLLLLCYGALLLHQANLDRPLVLDAHGSRVTQTRFVIESMISGEVWCLEKQRQLHEHTARSRAKGQRLHPPSGTTETRSEDPAASQTVDQLWRIVGAGLQLPAPNSSEVTQSLLGLLIHRLNALPPEWTIQQVRRLIAPWVPLTFRCLGVLQPNLTPSLLDHPEGLRAAIGVARDLVTKKTPRYRWEVIQPLRIRAGIIQQDWPGDPRADGDWRASVVTGLGCSVMSGVLERSSLVIITDWMPAPARWVPRDSDDWLSCTVSDNSIRTKIWYSTTR